MSPRSAGPGLRLGPRERLFRRYLAFISRPGAVRAAVGSLDLRRARPPDAGPPGGDGRRVRVAAVQMDASPVRSVEEYVRRVGGFVRDAVARGADLVAFPEYVTYPLLGLLPGFEEMSGAGSGDGKGGGAAGAGATEPETDRPALRDVVLYVEPLLRNVYQTAFSRLAAAARVHIAAGSTPMPDPDGRVYNVAALFDPAGRLVGTQAKLHLYPTEAAEGLSPGDRLEVFVTGVGRMALPVCMDATFFETYRLAALEGAEIVTNPIADVDTYSYWKKLRGAWPRVQETPVYAVQSALVGEFLGRPMTGKAAVYAPMELTPAGDGVLAESPEPVGDGMVVADLDLDALAEFRERHPVFGRFNAGLIRNYLPQVYERFARDRRRS
ncbi:MAG TPA: nitrilase [Clostridiales bacterium]|nr:nitrilase [Clostridiales bacterium]